MSRRKPRAAARTSHKQLDEQDIVGAALQLIREHGAEHLSMRALAAELGVTPMAIYHHVPNKEALLDCVVDAVLSKVPTPTPDPQRWQAQLKDYAITTWRLVGAYPGLSRILISRPGGKSVRALVRYGISILLAAGFEPRDAARAIATFHSFMYGAYAALGVPALPERRERRNSSVRRLDRGGEDDVREVARHLRELRIGEWLDYGLDAVLGGLADRARPARTPRRRTRTLRAGNGTTT